jgi:hypothetical protein
MTTACFPTNSKAQHIAFLTEGAMIVAGIVTAAMTPTAASCVSAENPWEDYPSCDIRRDDLTGLSLGLIVSGVVGLIVTAATNTSRPSSIASARTRSR